MIKKALPLGLLILAAWLVFKEPVVSYGPGVFAAEIPLQKNLTEAAVINFKGYNITPLASFDIKAKVLSRENYYIGRESELSPLDLTLGWGNMSDESVLAHIDISQSNRWYHWRSETLPISSREISRSSANMHMVPKDDWIASKLEKVSQGDIVHIRGSLIKINHSDGWNWKSSLSRKDTGGGACELIYVESIYIDQVK